MSIMAAEMNYIYFLANHEKLEMVIKKKKTQDIHFEAITHNLVKT